jgi:hypothetical protein
MRMVQLRRFRGFKVVMWRHCELGFAASATQMLEQLFVD